MNTTNLYGLGDVVKVRHTFMNSDSDELVGTIKGILTDENSERVKYYIDFKPTEADKKIGIESHLGYVFQEEIVGIVKSEDDSDDEEKNSRSCKEAKKIVTERLLKFSELSFYDISRAVGISIEEIEAIESLMGNRRKGVIQI